MELSGVADCQQILGSLLYKSPPPQEWRLHCQDAEWCLIALTCGFKTARTTSKILFNTLTFKSTSGCFGEKQEENQTYRRSKLLIHLFIHQLVRVSVSMLFKVVLMHMFSTNIHCLCSYMLRRNIRLYAYEVGTEYIEIPCISALSTCMLWDHIIATFGLLCPLPSYNFTIVSSHYSLAHLGMWIAWKSLACTQVLNIQVLIPLLLCSGM